MGQRSLGMVILGMASAALGLLLVMVLASAHSTLQPPDLAGRGSVLVLASLSLVTAEALMLERTWAFRATATLACASTAALAWASGPTWPAALAVSLTCLGPPVAYVWSRTRPQARWPLSSRRHP
jgi:hypothetical protein